MRTIITIASLLILTACLDASDRKTRGRSAWAWASCQQYVEPTVSKPATTVAESEATDALAEVNAERAKRGLRAFIEDIQLTQAARKAARQRASRGIDGHLPESDFTCLPAGAHADAAGCGALDDSWGWGTCCTYDNYTHAGAAWVRGTNGKRYMHLFVRNESTPMAPVARTAETVTATSASCSSGSCSSGSWQPGGIITRGRRGR